MRLLREYLPGRYADIRLGSFRLVPLVAVCLLACVIVVPTQEVLAFPLGLTAVQDGTDL
jgi:hypothetical protein